MTVGLGTGIFSVPEAARMLQVPPGKLHRWLIGSQSHKPALPTPPATTDGVLALAFSDLISAMFINAFRRQGLSLQYIRRVALKAAAELENDRPFSLKDFATDGRRIYQLLGEANAKKGDVTEIVTLPPVPYEGRRKPRRGDVKVRQLLDVEAEQIVISQVIRPLLREIDYGIDAAAKRWWPLGRDRGVVVDPTIALGEPTVRGIPTRVLYGPVSAGEKQKTVADWYGITSAEVLAACAFERKIHAKAA